MLVFSTDFLWDFYVISMDLLWDFHGMFDPEMTAIDMRMQGFGSELDTFLDWWISIAPKRRPMTLL